MFCKFELLSGGNMLHAACCYQLERQICKIEATLEKTAVQYCLVDTRVLHEMGRPGTIWNGTMGQSGKRQSMIGL